MHVCIRFDEPAKPTQKSIQVWKGGKLEKCSVMNVKKQEHCHCIYYRAIQGVIWAQKVQIPQ